MCKARYTLGKYTFKKYTLEILWYIVPTLCLLHFTNDIIMSFVNTLPSHLKIGLIEIEIFWIETWKWTVAQLNIHGVFTFGLDVYICIFDIFEIFWIETLKWTVTELSVYIWTGGVHLYTSSSPALWLLCTAALRDWHYASISNRELKCRCRQGSFFGRCTRGWVCVCVWGEGAGWEGCWNNPPYSSLPPTVFPWNWFLKFDQYIPISMIW